MSRVSTVATAAAVRDLVGGWHAAGQSVALVPTMGNLHDGHLSLVRLAHGIADRVVVSIFVNPTQFGAGEDFASYPRTLDDDRTRLEETGIVAALFVPDERQIYPFGTERAVKLAMPQLSRELCGAFRPGHFDGVASVVCRLLNIVAPESVVLGRKDYQQLVLLEHMIADLNMPVRVVSGPTLREPDGVAMSSRNRYLTAAERRRAPMLRRALEHVRGTLAEGTAARDQRIAEALAMLRQSGFEPEYVEVRRARDLGRPEAGDAPDDLLVLGAARLGRARLIDNTSR